MERHDRGLSGFTLTSQFRAPSLQIAYQQPRIGTNEYLYLTANVQGVPKPESQWFLNGVELPSQTHAGLRVWVENEEQVGNYTLYPRCPSNHLRCNELPTSITMRTRLRALVDSGF